MNKFIFVCLFILMFGISFGQKEIKSTSSEQEKIAYLIEGERIRNGTKILINDSLYDFDCMSILLKSKEKLDFQLISDSVQKQALSSGCKKVTTLIKVIPAKKFLSEFSKIATACKPYIFSCEEKTRGDFNIEKLLNQLAKYPIDAS